MGTTSHQLCLSVSFSVMINGEPKGNIAPPRGLRQGCPISPYLFLFCAKALSTLIKKAEDEQRLHGLKLNVRCPSISYLLFADDSLLFFRADKDNALKVKQILASYKAATGQSINYQKSGLAISPGLN